MKNLVPFILKMSQAHYPLVKELASSLSDFQFTGRRQNYFAGGTLALGQDEAASRENDFVREERLNDMMRQRAKKLGIKHRTQVSGKAVVLRFEPSQNHDS